MSKVSCLKHANVVKFYTFFVNVNVSADPPDTSLYSWKDKHNVYTGVVFYAPWTNVSKGNPLSRKPDIFCTAIHVSRR